MPVSARLQSPQAAFERSGAFWEGRISHDRQSKPGQPRLSRPGCFGKPSPGVTSYPGAEPHNRSLHLIATSPPESYPGFCWRHHKTETLV